MEFAPKISDPPKPGSARLAKKELRIEVGAELFKRFILLAQLGQGRCSTSWLVEDPRFRRDVVLKLFRSASIGETDEERTVWRDFLRRLRILNHPDIVITMEFFHEGYWLALSSEHENGPTLAALTFLARKKLPLNQSQAILKTVGQALAAAHDKCQIVHGNLNAYNILLPIKRRTAKITDFGFHPPLLPPGEEINHPDLPWKLACLSPERLRGGPPSHADDIYAYATVAFQLFTGKNPPLNTSGMLDLEAAKTGLADSPPNWRKSLLIALSPDPAQRPETLALLLQELNIHEEFNPFLKQLEKAQVQLSPKKKEKPHTPQAPSRIRQNTHFLFRAFTILCAIAMPVIIGWTVYHSRIDTHQLEIERYKEEKMEKAQEAKETAQVMQLNDRLGGDLGPSKANIDLYRQTLNAPSATPKPTPRIINTGARDFYHEGQAKLAGGDPAGAMESYELAIVLQPDWPDLLEARGTALLAAERADKAILEYSKALIIEPARVTSLIGRAKAHLARRDVSSAKADLQTLLNLDPNNIEAKALLEKNNLIIHRERGIIQ